MCAGIRDAANLAWKLALVCTGRAEDALLDTYQIERHPHVQAYIEGAVASGQVIQMRDPAQLAERVRDMRAHPKQYAPPNPALGPGLATSYGLGPLGRQVAQPHLDGQLLDAHLGHGFALLFRAGVFNTAALDQLAAAYPALKMVGLPQEQADLLACPQAGALLVRPDRYLHAEADTAAQCHAMLASLPIAWR